MNIMYYNKMREYIIIQVTFVETYEYEYVFICPHTYVCRELSFSYYFILFINVLGSSFYSLAVLKVPLLQA